MLPGMGQDTSGEAGLGVAPGFSFMEWRALDP